MGLGLGVLPFSIQPDGSMRLYFKITRWAPKQMVRSKTSSEVGLNTDMVAIACCRVIKEAINGNPPVVATEGVQLTGDIQSQPLVLSFASLSVEQLVKMIVYPVAASVHRYGLKDGIDIHLSSSGWTALPDVLRMLTEGNCASGMLPPALDGGPVAVSEVLGELVKQGLVHEPDDRNAKFMLTDSGQQSIEIGLALNSPTSAAGDKCFC